MAAAMGAFALARGAAAALGIEALPLSWRVVVAGAGLLPLAIVDLRAMRRSTYCPIGWRRQTPRWLLRRHHLVAVAAVWGFDTGLVVTTIRVAAVSWGALYLAALGLAPSWVGLAYGAGFMLPFLALLVRPGLGRAARSTAPLDPGLEALLGMRFKVQALSLAALLVGGVGLLGAALH